MSQITSHVLDTAIGKPAKGINLSLSQFVDNEWKQLGEGITDSDGRVGDLLVNDQVLEAGRYKVIFTTERYFQKQKVDAFYPYAEIVFDIEGDGQHYHIPLLLSPFAYSTYRGS
ncbi:MAG: hydroxyisourate hydrolase [Cocleimonas sp.]